MDLVHVNVPGLAPMHFVVDDARDRVIAPFLKKYGLWEPSETAILSKIIKNGHNVIDIGANIGYYSVMFSGIVGSCGSVYSFEPEPDNRRLLSANLLINDCCNVVCEGKAISDRSDVQDLYLSSSNLGDHRLFACESRVSCKVNTISLDDYFPHEMIDFIKSDTQGAEPRVFAGMHRLVKRCRSRLGCLVEFSPGLLNQSGIGVDGYISQLHLLGARVHLIQARDRSVLLYKMASPSPDLRAIAGQMLATGVQDLSRDLVVFFSEEAERRFLADV